MKFNNQDLGKVLTDIKNFLTRQELQDVDSDDSIFSAEILQNLLNQET